MSAIQAPPQPAGPRSTAIGPAAWRHWSKAHQAGVWRYLRFLGAKRSEADDLTQETFLAFVRARFVERDARQTAAYLRTVARNQLLALRRRARTERSAVSSWKRPKASGPGSRARMAASSGYLDALRECVEQLVGRPRQAVELHYCDRASREAIAAELEMKPDGVKSLLRRTRDLLRECVERKINTENP